MENKYIPAMLVTANVGSIFEDPQTLLKIWVKEFLLTVKHFQPWFLALHCQEVGGKNYEESMRHVEDFVRMLMASEELMNYGQVRVYLDEDFTCTEKFTALGSLYFIHNNVKNVEIWDFKEHTFLPVEGKEVHSGNIERVTTKEKAKFPQEFFPECKWSRKGFMRTRWNINGTAFDLVNIHLFHDASNFVSVEAFPSAYTRNRQHALEYTLKRFQTDEYDKIPFFIFGDFNFRLDTPSVIQTITNQATPIHIKSAKNGEIVKMLYRDPVNENKVVLTLEKKVFDLENHEETFLKNNGRWLRDFDKELQTFENELYEFEITFPPSYPFMEDASGANCYMRTRCPSWCDRILFSKSAKSLVYMNHDEHDQPQVRYQLIGSNVAMGDHKPVLLWFRLLPATGMLNPLLLPTIVICPAPEIWTTNYNQSCYRTYSIPRITNSNNIYHKRRTMTSNWIENNNSPQLDRLSIDSTPLQNELYVSRQSSRFHSHHSSSSEEWFTDISGNAVKNDETVISNTKFTRSDDITSNKCNPIDQINPRIEAKMSIIYDPFNRIEKMESVQDNISVINCRKENQFEMSHSPMEHVSLQSNQKHCLSSCSDINYLHSNRELKRSCCPSSCIIV